MGPKNGRNDERVLYRGRREIKDQSSITLSHVKKANYCVLHK